MKILGLCGSLRQNSSNGFILKAAQNYFKNESWNSFELSRLPYFDPDQQHESTPQIVLEMRSLAAASDLIFISTPEYAHGVPGILKNALEWLFFEGTMKKPVALVIASAQGHWAREQLLEILKTMDFSIGNENCLLIHGARNKINSDGRFQDSETRRIFEDFCQSFTKRA